MLDAITLNSRRVPKLAWRVSEAAAAIAMSPKTLERDISNGTLKSTKRGSVRLILTADLLTYIGADDVNALVMTEVPSSQD